MGSEKTDILKTLVTAKLPLLFYEQSLKMFEVTLLQGRTQREITEYEPLLPLFT